MGIHYNFTKLDGYDCPIRKVISEQGLGKTFGKLKAAILNYIESGEKFVYVVENKDMVKELSANNGDTFFNNLRVWASERASYKQRVIDDALGHGEENTDSPSKKMCKVTSGAIFINGEVAGYLKDFNNAGAIKRNNFKGVKIIIIDEFIPLYYTPKHYENARKLAVVVERLARLEDVVIYMFANAINEADPILLRFNYGKLEKGNFYKSYVNGKLFSVLHYVNEEVEYPEYHAAHKKSVAGQFSELMGDTLNSNEFTNTIHGKLITKLPAVLYPVQAYVQNNDTLAIYKTRHGDKDYYIFMSQELKGSPIPKEKYYVADIKYAMPNTKHNIHVNRYIYNIYQSDAGLFYGQDTLLMFKHMFKLG